MNPINDQPVFFSVKHIITTVRTKLIYGIRHKDLDYFLYKTLGLNDCEQLDGNPKLDPEVFNIMCEVITEIEKEYKKIPPIEFINMDVFNILVNAKNPRFEDHDNYKR
jgi:hypothetical protein